MEPATAILCSALLQFAADVQAQKERRKRQILKGIMFAAPG